MRALGRRGRGEGGESEKLRSGASVLILRLCFAFRIVGRNYCTFDLENLCTFCGCHHLQRSTGASARVCVCVPNADCLSLCVRRMENLYRTKFN